MKAKMKANRKASNIDRIHRIDGKPWTNLGGAEGGLQVQSISAKPKDKQA